VEFLPDGGHAVPCEGGAADVFGAGNGTAPPAVDVKLLHSKIGELTLENDS
jgi:transposase